MLRVGFDPALPLVATSGFQTGSDSIAAGATFDWRARGMTELDALALFQSGLLTHPASATVAFNATPSERVVVETPAQERKRRARS